MKKLLLLVLLLASPAMAQLPPAGQDFQVNVQSQGSQELPDVARDAAGNFVVVWAEQGSAVRARLFHASGEPASGDITVANLIGLSYRPRVATTPQGAFVVVWSGGELIYLRRFDRLGRPAGDPVVVSPAAGWANRSPDVVLDGAGNAVVVWLRYGETADYQILMRRFDAADRPLGDPERVSQNTVSLKVESRVERNAAGSLLVTWMSSGSGLWARRFDGPSGLWGPEEPVDPQSFTDFGVPVLFPAGDGLVAYLDRSRNKVFVRRLDATGFQGAPVEAGDAHFLSTVGAAADPSGTVLVAWSQSLATGSIQVLGRYFDRSGTPLGEPFVVSPPSEVFDLHVAVAAGGPAGFTVAWANGDTYDGPIFPGAFPPLLDGRDGDKFGVFAQRFSAGRCEAGSDVLCLHDGRFEVRASWKANGEEGKGRSLALSSDTGALWFFQRENLELMIKVLDARAVNGSFWVYIGALSDVEYAVEVTDTVTGITRTYRNPPGRQASQADIDDFPAAPAPAQDAAKTALELPVSSPKAEGLCQPSPTALCLGEGRFRVEVELTDPRSNTQKQAVALPLTADTGAFWFFNAENLELMIKILDGRPHNGHFWIYYGALSDVPYTITVTDTQTGEHETYENQPGRLVSRSDVEAF